VCVNVVKLLLFLLLMKNLRPTHPPSIIDQNYINSIFDNLQDRI